MPEIKTAVINLGGDLIYKIVVPDPETPNEIEIYWTNQMGIEQMQTVVIGGSD